MNRRVLSRWSVPAMLVSAAAFLAGAAPVLPPPAGREVDFARDVAPIFERHCISCHGPERQRGGFRLDQRDAALAGGDGGPAILPGRSAHSPLVHFVAGYPADMLMPQKGDPLTPAEIGVLRAWIDQGAQWDGAAAEAAGGAIADAHWAFQPVQRPPLPAAASATGDQTLAIGNPLDAFIREALAAEGLAPSPTADRRTLVRRLHLVMLGLPPTPEEVTAFAADDSPEAWERQVDRVLADPRYGERWGRHWLDVVRYAESNGFETNRERPHAWRYRDYVIAAFNDDLPYDRFIREQLAGDAFGAEAATGFLVAGPVDIVKSPDPALTAKQRADELDDMVATTGTTFLGLTLGCARCHTHKFDPVSHREYHALAAMFAGVQHGDRALPPPPGRAAELAATDERIRDLEAKLARFVVPQGKRRPPVNAAVNEEDFPPVEAKFIRFTILETTGGEPCLDELQVFAEPLEAPEAGSLHRNVALAREGAIATASGTLPGFAIHRLEHVHDGETGNDRSWISNEPGRGWVQLEFARPERIHRILWGRDRTKQFKDRLATRYRIEAALEPGAWTLVASSDDREPYTGGDGQPAKPAYRFDDAPPADAAQGRQWLTELERERKERAALAEPLRAYAGTFTAPPPTYRFHRGDPMQPREEVAPGTLAIFRPLNLATNATEQERRVALAGWIADPENPLTARVLVNRVWQHHFGVGLVDTPNDFGRNGARPSHPALLDWLAAEFIASGGSVKHLQRLILTSATWRQAAAPREDALRVDAGNRLLWRFPPRRLEAEAIRDGILAVSGTLDPTSGGPGFLLHEVERENVYHYHPKEAFGPAESRRMVYAVKVRMEQDAIFGAFDCPDGSLVMPRRSASTTPLQALNLFNSRFLLDQADALAARLRREAGEAPAAQAARAWGLAFGRPPAPAEAAEAAAFIGAEGLPALARAVLNANEFLFLP